MKQIGRRTILLGAAALCWGILFPEYTFTMDSYTMFMQEAEEAEDVDEAVGSEEAESVEELLHAVREGKVRYCFRFYEYLKNIFSAGWKTNRIGLHFYGGSIARHAGKPDLKGALFIYGAYGTRQICADRSI